MQYKQKSDNTLHSQFSTQVGINMTIL